MHILHFTQFGSEREIVTEIWTICQLQAKAVILLVICIYSSNYVSVYDLFNKKQTQKKKYSQYFNVNFNTLLLFIF